MKTGSFVLKIWKEDSQITKSWVKTNFKRLIQKTKKQQK